jgi:DNA-binding MarR family transcriptional regulator
MARALHDALGAVSAQLRLRFAGSAPDGLGFVGMATLRHLVRHGPRTITELADGDAVTTQAVSLRVRPLEEAGWVIRTADAADGRRTIVVVTESGRAVVEAAESSTRGALARAVRRLPVADRKTVAAAVPALERLAALLAEDRS